MDSSTGSANWYLEGFVDERRETWRTEVTAFPFNIGRIEGSSLRLASPEVSSRHAELQSRNGDLWIRDLGSKNGSYVNDLRVTDETRLRTGDVLRFATWEFRLIHDESTSRSITQTLVLSTQMPGNLAKMVMEMREILALGRVTAYFQPIVRLSDGGLSAFEALGRGLNAKGETVPPGHLFDLAVGLRQEAQLSVKLRQKALEEAEALAKASVTGEKPVIFVNTHPAELSDGVGNLLKSLEELVEAAPWGKMVLEIHEAAVASSYILRELGAGVADLGIDLAFDDFGTGQARLLELVDVAPRYLKFDRAWISGVHLAGSARLEMLERLVTMVSGLGVATLAEGVEKEEEAEVCRRLGFDLAQGYHFGRPAPAETFLDPA